MKDAQERDNDGRAASTERTEHTDSEPGKFSEVRVRRNGVWVPLESARPTSDDSEIEQLWEMGLEELNAIVEDETHPLHDKAVVVAAQAFAPITDAVAKWSASAAESISGAISELGSTPGINKSWVTDLVIDSPYWMAFRDSLPEPTNELVIEGIDLDSADAPDITVEEFAAKAPSVGAGLLTALLDNSDAQLKEQRDQNVTLRAQLEAQQEHMSTSTTASDEALKVAKSAKRGSWLAAWAAIAGALIALGALGATLNMLS